MDGNKYQEAARNTAIYRKNVEKFVTTTMLLDAIKYMRINYCAMKLAGEAGEVAENVGKALRDDNGDITAERKTAILTELGDVLWYCANLADELDTNLSEVMDRNIAKLQDRQRRDMLKGSGDNR